MSSLLRVSNVSVEYHVAGKSIMALDGASVELSTSGDTTGIVGESGSGKTTLGMGIMKVIEPPGRIIQGNVDFKGKDVFSMSIRELREYRWEQVSMVYQSAMNSLNPVRPIIQPIVEVLRSHKHISKQESTEIAIELLDGVGIKHDRVFDYPHEISGGMRQRVVIALALALSPRILIADEPTSALDVVTQQQILSLLKKEVKEKELSLIFITHEISLLNGLVDKVAVMYEGEVVESGPLNKVLFDPKHPYTEMLSGTLLTLDSELKQITEFAKSAAREASYDLQKNACKYVSRCKYAFDRCKNERPRLAETEYGRLVACHRYS